MYAAWLATVLVGVGVDQVQSPPAPACVIGADQEDVALMLGRPDKQAVGCLDGSAVPFWLWKRVDWLGSRRTRVVLFLDGVAESDRAECEPFAETPAWLGALRDAFGPRPTP